MSLLTVSNLSKSYDKKIAVNDICFALQPNTCIALIGPNGAGKTTILKSLAGLLKHTTGTVRFNGKPSNDIRPFIGYLPQFPVFYSWMTGKEFLIYSGRLAFMNKYEAIKQSEKLLHTVGISEAKNKRIGTYSGGMKQRLGIAQAIIHNPKLLLLDEPVSSLDPIGRREVLTLMEELKNNMTILFSTHILTDADEISDELLLLYQGKIVESGTMNDLRHKYQTEKMELGFESNPEMYQTKINKFANVNTSFIDRHLLHISATDINLARKEILATASEENWPLTSFAVNRASLEDMFMRVVNK